MPLDDLPWAVPAVRARAGYYRLHRDYYEGEHALAFASTKFRSTFGYLFENLRDNLCPPVVDALVDRLQVTGWHAAGNATNPVATLANDVWTANRAGRSGQVHLGAARDGDAYLLVWPGRDTRPRFWPQDAGLMAVEYDDEDDPERIVRAAKLWQRSDKRWRLNVYTIDAEPTDANAAADAPGLIERWVTRRRTDDMSGLEKPARWEPWLEDADGPEVRHPWGVPVFHFPNGAPAGQLGRSELHDVVPLQDALNKTIADMLVAGEFVALPQRVLIGIEKEVDPLTGHEVKLDPGADRIWRITNPNGKVAEFTAADLAKFVQVSDSFRLEVCRVSGTPLADMMLSGSVANLSGDALGHLAGRMTRKGEDRVGEWTPIHRAAMVLACRMAGATDPAALEQLRPTWAPVEDSDELRDMQVAALKLQVGWSKAQVLRELGKTDDEVAAIQAEVVAEAGAMGEAMLASFDRGNVPAPVAPRQGGADIKAKADAMGVLIRAGVDPENAADQVGLDVDFTGAVPTSLRLPTTDAAALEGT